MIDPDSYNHFRFADWLHKYFKIHPCLLCGEIHELDIFKYKPRKISPDNSKEALVVRIWCDTHYEENLISDKDIQYTITVLPGFLIPFSRVPVPDIWNAAEGYLNENMTQQQAALQMNCSSRHSFSRYYRRLCSRFTLWIMILAKMLNVPPPEQNPEVKAGWKSFKILIAKLRMEKVAKSSGSIISRFQFALTILGGCKMGLGP